MSILHAADSVAVSKPIHGFTRKARRVLATARRVRGSGEGVRRGRANGGSRNSSKGFRPGKSNGVSEINSRPAETEFFSTFFLSRAFLALLLPQPLSFSALVERKSARRTPNCTSRRSSRKRQRRVDCARVARSRVRVLVLHTS